MSAPLYLTIDDSPSGDTGRLLAGLKERDIQALLYCRGDRLADNPVPVVAAIANGFPLGNHAWSHTRFSALSLEEGIGEIERTDALIDAAYRTAGVACPGRYFRFPHLDRGAGGWVIDYNAAGAHRRTVIDLFAGGLNIDLTPPAPALVEKKARLQDWLRANGFGPPPAFAAVRLPWYAQTEMATAADCLFTFSTSDWMVTPRHAGKWPYKTLADLKRKIDDDEALRSDGAQIILAHDQDGLVETVLSLTDHFIEKGFRFGTF